MKLFCAIMIQICLFLSLPAETVTYSDLLKLMTDLDRLWQPPVAGEKNVQFSSFDRQSLKGPGDPAAWYANADRGKYLRVETRNGEQEYVMVDVDGPGVVVRIWSANPQGRLFFYIDGETDPTWSVDFAELTSGSMDPFPEPLSGVRARGANFHVPVPFNKHLKLTASNDDFYYQVNVRSLAAETEVESFHPSLLSRYKEMFSKTAEILTNPHRLFERQKSTSWLQMIKLERSGENQSLWSSDCFRFVGPGVIRGIRLKTALEDPMQNFPELLRKMLFCVEVDGHQTVKVPVSDFFASAPAYKPYQSYPMGVTDDGWGYVYFPMPVKASARIYLGTEEALPAATWRCEAVFERREIPESALSFRAAWHMENDVRTRPFRDHRILSTTGSGRFVGCSVVVANPTKAWWGEGDEKFFVDGESFPSTFGTGTEDYFGYAWCSPELFASPYHAQPQCDGPGNFGYTCNNRFQIHDMVPFQESFLFDMEIWHWKDVFMDYSSTAYWYGAADAPTGCPDIPPFSRRGIEKLELPKPWIAAGALEGEALKIVSCSGGTTQIQDLDSFASRRWSRDQHIWWREGEPGDRLILAVPVETSGTYSVIAAFTKAIDYGIIQVSLAGKKLNDPIDLFHRGVVSSGEINLGRIRLSAGTVRLTVELVGKNDQAVPKYMAGLDYLKLVKEGG